MAKSVLHFIHIVVDQAEAPDSGSRQTSSDLRANHTDANNYDECSLKQRDVDVIWDAPELSTSRSQPIDSFCNSAAY